ncbi:MAG: threonine synthase [Pseudomonadota bacterium]
MRYISTRGQSPSASFDDVLTTALAPDGGLFVPEHYPAPLKLEADASFADISAAILHAFAEGDMSRDEAAAMTREAYATFRHPQTTPVVGIGGHPVLELFHGPTLAFKDVAMQLLARLFERSLKRSGRTMQVIVATSGDTGGAAVASLAGREGVKLCVLHPYGRISEVQRRFMTTHPADNILNLALEGTFDDCQSIVKALFADRSFADEVSLGGVNSINWARIAAQVTYYFAACQAVGQGPVHFSVPTGNFGDIFAGWVAKKLGAPVGMLIVAVNDNDILHRALTTGDYDKRGVKPTVAPSMDIEVASNFERAIFEVSGRDAELTAGLLADLKTKGNFTLPPSLKRSLSEEFMSARAGEAEINEVIGRLHRDTGTLIDPHTAIGISAAEQARANGLEGPIVTLATAHPAKFPEAVEAASGEHPALPIANDDLYNRQERFSVLTATEEAVKKAIRSA